MKRVLKFSADWCMPCKVVTKTLEKIDSNISIETIDVGSKEGAAIAAKYSVMNIPTVLFLKDEAITDTLTGNVSLQTLKDAFNTLEKA